MSKVMNKTRMKILMALTLGLFSILGLSGCEKVANQAKNIQSDWVGLDRVVQVYSCMSGKLIKEYRGDVRLNPEDGFGTSLLIDGKKLYTNMCYVIAEQGIKEEVTN
jgi:hypothetical protein